MLPERHLSRAEASVYLYEHHGIRHSLSYLSKLAHLGGGKGPKYFLIKGRLARYRPKHLDEYAASITSEAHDNAAAHKAAAAEIEAARRVKKKRAPQLDGLSR